MWMVSQRKYSGFKDLRNGLLWKWNQSGIYVPFKIGGNFTLLRKRGEEYFKKTLDMLSVKI